MGSVTVIQRKSAVDSLLSQILNSARDYGVSVSVDFPAKDDDGVTYIKFGSTIYTVSSNSYGLGCHRSYRGESFKRVHIRTLLESAPGDIFNAAKEQSK